MSNQNPSEKIGHVYVIDLGDRRKIGCSQNPERRVGSILQNAGIRDVPYFISLPHEGYRETEKILHEYFARHRLVGEWFSARYDDISAQIRRLVPVGINGETYDSQGDGIGQQEWGSILPSLKRNGPPEFAHFKFNEPGLDEDDCLAGYRAGLDGDPEPGSDKSRSFMHGWRNAMADKGRLPISREQREYAESYVRAQRAH